MAISHGVGAERIGDWRWQSPANFRETGDSAGGAAWMIESQWGRSAGWKSLGACMGNFDMCLGLCVNRELDDPICQR